ncbi:glycosyltransferase family 32 protein [Neobacillus vireti]|uniref:glycosyltransferase family 32 protein n=1 Tax=Neobacillus vireti TaxID=220686 RepID=UPI002FFF1B06
MEAITKIPKVIHYCWFGGKEKPDIVKKCINSWDRYLSDYKVLEWNESNFDINLNTYVKEAYNLGKFAFVSDYVRVYALFNYGGIYLDTDVEIFKSFDNLLHHESFWGFEQGNFIATSTIGAEKENKLIKLFLDSYSNQTFQNSDGSNNEITNVAIITKLLEGIGFKLNGQYQEIEGLGVLYPQTYFSPYDYINCRNFITAESYSVHHFYKSWLPPGARIKSKMKVYLSHVIGGSNIERLRRIFQMN